MSVLKPVIKRSVAAVFFTFVWQTYDAVQASMAARNPLQSGLLDLNRYQDPKSDDVPQ